MQIVLATRNLHKAQELERILNEQNLEIEILTIDKFPNAPEVPETEDTFEGNALLKAVALSKYTGLPAIADDSGICIDALSGSPGVRSARWSGATENVDQTNLNLVLEQMEAITEEKRGAQFVCAAVAVFPDGRQLISRGTVDGQITRAPKGTHGFGYDPIFQPNGLTKTTAEMSASEKDSISHRGLALRDLASQLRKVIS